MTRTRACFYALVILTFTALLAGDWIANHAVVLTLFVGACIYVIIVGARDL